MIKNLLKKLCVAGWRGEERMSALLTEYDANSYLAILQKGYVDYGDDGEKDDDKKDDDGEKDEDEKDDDDKNDIIEKDEE